MYLGLAGREIDATVQTESTFRSRHSGAELRRVKANLVVEANEENNTLLEVLGRAPDKRELSSTDGHGTVLARWRIVDSSYRQTLVGGHSTYHHFLELEEAEDLKPKRPHVSGRSLEPYSYHEEFDDDALIIEAKVQTTKSELDEFKKLLRTEGYFPVVREGISSEARDMRFGRPSWSAHEENVKLKLILVDKVYDDRQHQHPFTEHIARIFETQDLLAQYIEILEELLRHLADRDILTKKEVDELRANATQRTQDRIMELRRVKDID